MTKILKKQVECENCFRDYEYAFSLAFNKYTTEFGKCTYCGYETKYAKRRTEKAIIIKRK